MYTWRMSIRCGHCKGRHVYVRDVLDCAYTEYDDEANARAEYLAEQAAERFWEEGTPAQQMQYAWEVEQDERHF